MLTLHTDHLTRNELNDAFAGASPGSTIVYATGDIGGDRDRAKKQHPNNYHAINLTAELALELAGYTNRQGVGRVFEEIRHKGCLTQKKITPGVYQYRITKRR